MSESADHRTATALPWIANDRSSLGRRARIDPEETPYVLISLP